MTSEFQALLKRVIEYDPATGVFRWKDPGANRMKLGDVAGTVRTDGYCLVCIAGTTFLAHRLAWIYSFGHWPKLDLDHINGDPSDNRLVNLREVDHTSNMQNRKRQTNNLSGAPRSLLGLQARTMDRGNTCARRSLPSWIFQGLRRRHGKICGGKEAFTYFRY